MRVVLFTAGGPLGRGAFEALTKAHDIAAIVRSVQPAGRSRRLVRWALRRLRLRRADRINDWARVNGVPVLQASSRVDPQVLRTLNQCAPDIVSVAAFPFILGPELLAAARLGAVNLHPSLLPRHRGADPLFWTYYHDDRVTGVTVHAMTSRLDAGPILAQERVALPRGRPAADLLAELVVKGGNLLANTVSTFQEASARATAQDEALATAAPSLQRTVPEIDFAAWGAGRVWHFLSALLPYYRHALYDTAGRKVRYRSVEGFDDHILSLPAGSVIKNTGGWTLACHDGTVRLSRRRQGVT